MKIVITLALAMGPGAKASQNASRAQKDIAVCQNVKKYTYGAGVGPDFMFSCVGQRYFLCGVARADN